MSLETLTVDQDTGEVVLSPEELAILEGAGSSQSENCFDLEKYVDQVGDIIASKLERAQRYREQAEKRSKPLERSAEYLLLQITPHLRQLAEAKLPKYMSGDHAGQYKSKTLHLSNASFAFTKAGGNYIANEQQAMDFIREVYPLYPDIDKCIETVEKLDKPKLLSYLEREKLLEDDNYKERLMGFVGIVKEDPLASVKVKL